MPRVSLAVDSSLGEELSRIAKKRNMTLYALTNQIIDAGLKVMQEGMDLEVLRDLWQAYKILRDIDAVVLPSDFMDKLLSMLYSANQSAILESFHNLGRDFGKYLKIIAEDPASLFVLAPKILRFFPLKSVNIKALDQGIFEISGVGIGGTIESTLCVAELAKGILEEYELEILDLSVAKGILKIKIHRKNLTRN